MIFIEVVSISKTLGLKLLQEEIVQCRLCPRLVNFREKVAREKRLAYRNFSYWGKPVPSLGEAQARLLIVGLAPGAHGANRTGRMFTGDRSGDFLYAGLYRAGFCNQPDSLHREDNFQLIQTYITAPVHCVPPRNLPSSEERKNCQEYLFKELNLLTEIRVIMALGGIAWKSILSVSRKMNWNVPRPLPLFGHGALCELTSKLTLIGSYHPSQQNTQTGRLTREMFDDVLKRIHEYLDLDS